MKYNIRTERFPDFELTAIKALLGERDPAGLVDTDAERSLLRFSTRLGSAEVLALMADIGCPVDATELQGVPSECCGDCGG